MQCSPSLCASTTRPSPSSRRTDKLVGGLAGPHFHVLSYFIIGKALLEAQLQGGLILLGKFFNNSLEPTRGNNISHTDGAEQIVRIICHEMVFLSARFVHRPGDVLWSAPSHTRGLSTPRSCLESLVVGGLAAGRSGDFASLLYYDSSCHVNTSPVFSCPLTVRFDSLLFVQFIIVKIYPGIESECLSTPECFACSQHYQSARKEAIGTRV